MSKQTRYFRFACMWAAILLVIYGGFLLYLYAMQDSLIFFPKPTTDDRWKQIIEEELHADYVSIRADDGEVLEGMFLSDHSEEPRPTVIFFGGNDMRVEEYAHLFQQFPQVGINVLLMDYRGYGLSTGKPNANAMKRDAQKIFDAAASHPQIDANRITVWGYSLGTGIAMHLAGVKPIEKVILFAPFTSIAELAKTAFPFVPVTLLLKDDFDNLALASTRTQPALIVHGEQDNQIPVEQAERIASTWGGDAEFQIAEDKGHNDLLLDQDVMERAVIFILSGAAEEI